MQCQWQVYSCSTLFYIIHLLSQFTHCLTRIHGNKLGNSKLVAARPSHEVHCSQDSKMCAQLRCTLFGLEHFIMKTIRVCDVMTILNERKHLEMAIRLVPDTVSLISDRTK
jgi:hypothetical protein